MAADQTAIDPYVLVIYVPVRTYVLTHAESLAGLGRHQEYEQRHKRQQHAGCDEHVRVVGAVTTQLNREVRNTKVTVLVRAEHARFEGEIKNLKHIRVCPVYYRVRSYSHVTALSASLCYDVSHTFHSSPL